MKGIFLVLLCTPMLVFSQVCDHFLDGDFKKDPKWTGDTGQFKVNASHQLQLNSGGSDTAILVTGAGYFDEQTWKIRVKLSFNTSTNNFARVYLIADTSSIDKDVRGYYLQAGGQDDSISIVRQNRNDHHRLRSFRYYKTDKSTNSLGLQVMKNKDGKWRTFIDTLGGGNYVEDCSFTDTLFRNCRYFGVFCRYTSSNSTRIYFDDVYSGPEIKDSVSPALTSCHAEDSVSVRLRFSEGLKFPEAADPGHYFLVNQSSGPAEVKSDDGDPKEVILRFSMPFEEEVRQDIRITGLTDISGNRMRDTLAQFIFYRPKAFDILVNEIMADPEPSAGIPAQEYVELYNITNYPVGLEGWSFTFGSTKKILPSVTIEPKGFLLLVRDSLLFSVFGKTIGLFTSSSSLSNEGTTLTLKNKTGQVIHSVSYSPAWYHGSFKEEGGWSLEMVDQENPCGCEENWEASLDNSGGTPGRINSVFKENPDLTIPAAERAAIMDSSTVQVSFTEPMDSLSIRRENFILSGTENIFPVKLKLISPDYRRVLLTFDIVFNPGIEYPILLRPGIVDCAGNAIDTIPIFRVALPDFISTSELLINEILFNPFSGGSRFVEIFNPSRKVFDLSTVLLTDQDMTPEEGLTGEPITDEKILIFPGDYIAVTPDPADICSRYRCNDPRQIIVMKNFPSLDTESGTVILAAKGNQKVIDRAVYDKEMHYPLLSSPRGVSLERLSPIRSSEDRDNWHSAAESAGFATPGSENSQLLHPEESSSFATVSPEIFSPDNDGHDDILSIQLTTEEPGYQASITVFDVSGRLIRRVANNVLISVSENFSWDGSDEKGQKAPIGYYIVFVEALMPQGVIKRARMAVVLGGKL